jgi:hypothetical protein
MVLAAVGFEGGDGGLSFDLGSNLPQIILYADGLLLRREGERWDGGSEGYRYLGTRLTSEQMCQMLDTIVAAGFFELGEWPYTFDENAFDENRVPYCEGSHNYYVQVNGNPASAFEICSGWLEYERPEIAATRDVLLNYSLAAVDRYIPDWVWLEAIDWESDLEEELDYYGWHLTSQPWPSDLPSLTSERDQFRTLVLDGQDAERAFELFNYRIGARRFEEGGFNYLVVARPSLPHERSGVLWTSDTPYTYPLPFACEAAGDGG